MRWVFFLILTYVVLLVQTSLIQWISFRAGAAGSVQPDLLALVAVFVAIVARSGLDAMLAAWALGLAVDLTVGGGGTRSSALGVMPVAYALAAWAVYRLREVFFRERASTRILLTLLFCLLAHGLFVTLHTLLSWGQTTWGAYGRVLVQAIFISLYTAALAPLAHWLLDRVEPWLLVSGGGRARR
jgi:rod shape-determining protein MreD